VLQANKNPVIATRESPQKGALRDPMTAGVSVAAGPRSTTSCNRADVVVLRLAFFGFVFGASFYLFYNQAFHETQYVSDLPGHLTYSRDLIAHPLSVPHPLFHVLVLIVASLSSLGIKYAAAIVLAGLTTTLAIIIFWILKSSLIEQAYTEAELLFVTLLMMTVSSVFIPGLVRNFVLGQGSPNVWHSATLLAVKPLAFLAVFLIVNGHGASKSRTHYVIVLVVAFLSILAKPSFIFVFVPALWFFAAVRRKITDRRFLSFLIVLSIISAAAVTTQFMGVYHGASVYNEGDSGVKLDFLGVWSMYTKNVPLSIVLGLAFPLCVVLANPKRIYENESLLLCWLITIFGIVIAASLSESGRRYHHGNFRWSYLISQQLIFVFSMVEFLKWQKKVIGSVRYNVTAAALSLHIISGIIYTVRIWSGGFYF
jgi:hypothetical protein